MITVKCKDGKFIVPREEGFIGYEGDNLNVTKEIFVEGVVDMSLVFRMYLMFDDGTCNYFLVDSQVVENGTLITWNITNDQIYKDGIVQIQLKASNDSGEVFHSDITTMLVQTSIEFTDFFKEKENSEYLQHEEFLNCLLEKYQKGEEEIVALLEKANVEIENKQNELIEFVNQRCEDSEMQFIRLLEEFDNLTEDLNSIADSANLVLQKANAKAEEVQDKIQEGFDAADAKIADYTASVSDEVATEGSANLITSGAVYEEVKNNINYVDMGQISKISAFDDMTDSHSIYVFILAKNVISGITDVQQARCINVGSYQIVELTDGRTYARQYSNEAWSDFEKTKMSYQEFVTYVTDYELEKTIISEVSDEEQTFETLKNLRDQYKVFYFDLYGEEVGSAQNIAGLTYLNRNTQVIKLIDGSEYVRTFTQKGTTTNWTNLEQVGFNKTDLVSHVASELIETGSGSLVPDSEIAESATYSYMKIGNMVFILITMTITKSNVVNAADFNGLPFEISNLNPACREVNVLTYSGSGYIYRLYGVANIVWVNMLDPKNHQIIYPTVDDVVNFSFMYYTDD